MSQGEDRVVATNRKARHNFDILDTFECGMVLKGSEVKSLRAAQVQLKDGYGEIRRGELWLENIHIAPYLDIHSPLAAKGTIQKDAMATPSAIAANERAMMTPILSRSTSPRMTT